MCIRQDGCSPRHRTHRNSAHRSCWQAQDGASGVGRPPEGLLQVAMKRIGLLTSGGDASGMNAAIRAVARTAASMGVEAVGFERGYDGLVSNTWIELNARSVSGILELGGTMLKSARSELFRTEEGRKQAALVVQQNRLDGMVIIGGNGSQTGGYLLGQLGVPFFGVTATTENDLYGFDYTIGFDTAAVSYTHLT